MGYPNWVVHLLEVKMNIKSIGPKITEQAYNWLGSVFRTPNQGATYLLDAFPTLYKKTLFEIKDLFSSGELKSILDAFNSTILTPGLAGQHIQAQLEDAINLDNIHSKWQFEPQEFIKKISGLTAFQKAALEIWATAFWYGTEKDPEKYISETIRKGASI